MTYSQEGSGSVIILYWPGEDASASYSQSSDSSCYKKEKLGTVRKKLCWIHLKTKLIILVNSSTSWGKLSSSSTRINAQFFSVMSIVFFNEKCLLTHFVLTPLHRNQQQVQESPLLLFPSRTSCKLKSISGVSRAPQP